MFDLLAEHGLLVTKRKRSGCITTISRHRFRKYPNRIKGFVPTSVNELWVSDITYITLRNGFAYLSLITDAYSRKIVGFHLNKDLTANGPIMALTMALSDNRNFTNLIHHSDRGTQYCCDQYVALLQKNNIEISMTEKGDPLENALAERVNGILKLELLAPVFDNFLVAKAQVKQACSTYNHLRPHGSIDNMKPAAAHLQSGVLPKRWKNYYQINKARKEEQMAV